MASDQLKPDLGFEEKNCDENSADFWYELIRILSLIVKRFLVSIFKTFVLKCHICELEIPFLLICTGMHIPRMHHKQPEKYNIARRIPGRGFRSNCHLTEFNQSCYKMVGSIYS